MAVPTYKNVHSLDKYPPRYQVYLPANDSIQYCPFLETPNGFHAAHEKGKLEFIVPPFPDSTSPCVIKNVSSKPMFVLCFLNEPTRISYSRDDSIPCFNYQRYRKALLRTSLWPDFNLAYGEGEFRKPIPEFELNVKVSLRANSFQEANELLKRLLLHWQITDASVESSIVKTANTNSPLDIRVATENANLRKQMELLTKRMETVQHEVNSLHHKQDSFQG